MSLSRSSKNGQQRLAGLMARVATCDMCGKTTDEDNPVVTKLYLSPVNGFKAKDQHSSYSAHMDVGKCCLVKVNALGKWQKRKTRAKKAA